MSETIALTAPAEAASVPLLRRQLVGFLSAGDLSPARADDIRLAVSEALSNAVLHAYRGAGDPGAVELTAARHEDSIYVVVRDTGGGMAPRDDSPGLGLGLPVIDHTSDSFVISTPADAAGTEIHMRFDC